METVTIIMLLFSVILTVIIATVALLGLLSGWKRALLSFCRMVIAGILAFVAIKIFCLIIPASDLCSKIVFPIMNAAGLAVEDLALIYGSSALQTLTGALSYTIVLPFLFVPIFVVLYLLLLIPAYFVGRALGIYQSSEKKREMKELRRKQKLEKKYGISPDESAPVLEEAEGVRAQEKRANSGLYKAINMIGGVLINACTAIVIVAVVLLPLTGLMYTFTDGISNVTGTAEKVELNIKGSEPNQTFLNHNITNSEGYYDFHEINLLVDETLSPVCDNFYLKLSYSLPMRALYTGIGGSSDGDGAFRNEITQIFDLVANSLYLAVDFEDYGEDQKNAVNSIFAYVSKSNLHSEIAADVISTTCQELLESGKLTEMEEAEGGEAAKILIHPIVDIFANTTPESVRTDVNTVNELVIAVIDYKIPYEIAVAIATDSNDSLIRALANEDFLYEIINGIYQNKDFHDMMAPIINFSFFMISRQFDPDISAIDVSSNLEGLTDENLHYEAKVFSSILLDAVSIIDTIPAIMGSEDTSGSIENADMAALGRFLDDAMDSLFIGENINDLFVLILDSEVFDNMRGVANIIKSHMDDEDLCMEHLLSAVQQFTGILGKYENSQDRDMKELADTLRKLSNSFDPTTSAIIKEIINDSSVLNMNMISGGSDSTTANTQKLLSVFVDQLASGNISDEEFEKEAKAVDYAMQLLNASGSEDSSVKDVYNDSEGMQDMISTMAESKIAAESIKAIAYDDQGNLTPDALELSAGLDDNDIETLKAECETYYKTEAIKSDADIETIDNNLKAIAAVLGEDISEDINVWKAELGLNS